MLTIRRKIKITYLDEFNDEWFIVQLMSKQDLASWLFYFIDEGNKVIGVEEFID